MKLLTDRYKMLMCDYGESMSESAQVLSNIPVKIDMRELIDLLMRYRGGYNDADVARFAERDPLLRELLDLRVTAPLDTYSMDAWNDRNMEQQYAIRYALDVVREYVTQGYDKRKKYMYDTPRLKLPITVAVFLEGDEFIAMVDNTPLEFTSIKALEDYINSNYSKDTIIIMKWCEESDPPALQRLAWITEDD